MFQDTGRPIIGDDRYEGEDNVTEVLSGSRSYFDRKDVRESIYQQAEETLGWMQTNKQSYSACGDLKFEPWWPAPQETSCIMMKAAREKVLLDRAYEHGILHFLRGLETREVIDPLNDRIIGLVTDAMTPVVLNQLAMYRFSPAAPDGVTLSALSKLFGCGENTKPTKVRDRLLGDLSLIGLFKARENKGYDISIGTVGEIFFSSVYAPILNETSVNFKEKSS